MGNLSYLAVFWLAWALATVLTVTGDWTRATYALGLAILFRLFWQESRD